MKALYSILILSPFFFLYSSARGGGGRAGGRGGRGGAGGSTGVESTCENTFQVATCSPCQKTLFSIRGVDDYIIGIEHLDSYDYRDYCGDEKTPARSAYNETTAANITNILLDGCSNELNSLNKYTINPNDEINGTNGTNGTLSQSITVSFLHEYFSVAYFAAPTFNALCIPSGSNAPGQDFCGQIVKTSAYNQSIYSFEIFPPNTTFKETKTRTITKLPNDILCSECYLKITNTYLNWLSTHKLPGNIAANGYISGQYVNEFNETQIRGVLTQECGANSLNVVDDPAARKKNSTENKTSSAGPELGPGRSVSILSWGLIGGLVLGGLSIF